MNVEIGTKAPIFLFWEFLFQIFGILSLQSVEMCNGALLNIHLVFSPVGFAVFFWMC